MCKAYMSKEYVEWFQSTLVFLKSHTRFIVKQWVNRIHSNVLRSLRTMIKFWMGLNPVPCLTLTFPCAISRLPVNKNSKSAHSLPASRSFHIRRRFVKCVALGFFLAPYKWSQKVIFMCIYIYIHIWLVVSTHLKNMLLKLDDFPNFRVKIKTIWNHHLDRAL